MILLPRPPTAALLIALLALALAGSPAVADETAASGIQPPVLKPGRQDLLPFDDLERSAFQKEHGSLLYRIRTLSKQVASQRKQWAAHKNKKDPKAQTLQTGIRRLDAQLVALRARLSQELLAFGVEGPLIAYMNRAPAGPGRMERYAYGLVLLLDDLGPKQRALFGRVVTQMEGAQLSLAAQKERMTLALKQTELEKPAVNQLARTFDRQLAVIDKRFWQLVDITLTPEQRAWIWRRLPGRLKRKSQPAEHLYALPGLTPVQGARLKALLTEIEQESSPDTAAVKRIAAALRDKTLDGKARQALVRERADSYKRLGELRRYAAKTTREILTADQWLAYEAIPPRLSTGDRRASYKNVLEGFEPAPAQAARIKALGNEARQARREIRRRALVIQRTGRDFGPDSPQMMGVQMAMASMTAQGHTHQRELMGRIFLDVLTPEQVSRWAMGHFGYRR